MTPRTVRYTYQTGSVGLVATRQRRRPDLGPATWAVERFRYLGRGPRAHCLVALLRARGRTS